MLDHLYWTSFPYKYVQSVASNVRCVVRFCFVLFFQIRLGATMNTAHLHTTNQAGMIDAF